MENNFTFEIKRICFDENYHPSDNTRITTNFANLARGTSRQENLRNTLKMIDSRFNDLAHWDNPKGDRYSVDLEIISVEMKIEPASIDAFPLIEILKTKIIDKKNGKRIEGIAGNNFSSYVRDYDFSVRAARAQPRQIRIRHPGRLRRSARQAVQALPELERLPGNLRQTAGDLHQRLDQQDLSPDRESAPDPGRRVSPKRTFVDRPSISGRWACRFATSCRRTASRRWPSIFSATC